MAHSRNKGRAFEQLIATDFRTIYDGAEWVEHYQSLSGAQKATMRKTSRVRRGAQSHGASESDVLVTGTSWWFELQHAKRATPKKKLEQAERDLQHIGKAGSLLAVAITKQTGTGTILAHMRGRSLFYLVDGRFPVPGPVDETMITFSYETLLKLLEIEDKRE